MRKLLIDNKKQNFILKGLRSPSILEPAVPTEVNGKYSGEFQGIEIYEKVDKKANFPQTVADLVCNSYFRLTYQKPNGTSATFGTSIVGSISYKSSKENLRLIPAVDKAEIRTDKNGQIKTTVIAKFEEKAKLSLTRIYTQRATIGNTVMRTRINFNAMEDITLDSLRLGNDCFRLMTLSSMYSSEEAFDANILRYKLEEKMNEFPIQSLKNRERYFFVSARPTTEFELIKKLGSRGKLHEPGSPDSPSVRVKVLKSSVPTSELAIQGYLSESSDLDSDSLTVWLEWVKCPAVIPQGTSISVEMEVSAFSENN